MTHQPIALAPVPHPGKPIVLFDGTCRLCNGWAKFIIRHDRARVFTLTPVQSPAGQALLEWAGLPLDRFNTLVLVSDNRFYVRSEAMFMILARLPAPWCWLVAARIVPGPLRDWLYDKIALNRYCLFGRYDTCRLPQADHSQRFLTAPPVIPDRS